METVVVVGATGYLGRHLVVELSRRGFTVRAVVRSRDRAERPGPFGSPSLHRSVAEWAEGEITDPQFVRGLCRRATRVVSALGVTRQRASPWEVDYRANLRLLEDAEREAVRSFLYVNVMHASSGTSLILRSKAAFTTVLARSALPHQVINPSGYFSDIAEFLNLARRGVVVLPPDPGVRVAPIHGADLARFCVDKLGDTSGEWDVGGPDVFSYREIADLAFAALRRRPRTVVIPSWLLDAMVWAASRLGDRPRDLAAFFAEGLTRDAVGERTGSCHLADHFAELAMASRSTLGSA
jgi:uncharacterized protein YbjT (DUF2867 family)